MNDQPSSASAKAASAPKSATAVTVARRKRRNVGGFMGSILERKISKTNALSRLPGCLGSQNTGILPHSPSPRQCFFSHARAGTQFVASVIPKVTPNRSRRPGGNISAGIGAPKRLPEYRIMVGGPFPPAPGFRVGNKRGSRRKRQAGCEITKNV